MLVCLFSRLSVGTGWRCLGTYKHPIWAMITIKATERM